MTGATRRGRSAEGRAEVRRDLVAAAVALFRDRGYEDTTVDDIAAAAGVGRRTFFRYFRSKEDAISPDHETALARIAEVFATAHPDEPVTSLVLRAGETVFDLYTDDPPLSVARFRLTHEVPVLRDRESASVDHYRRLFTRNLRRRFAGERDGDLRAAVTGAAVVAAHNLALRAWLDDGAPPARLPEYRDRFRRVADLLPADEGLRGVAERLEIAVGRLERGAAS
ncbi:TetR family transcriptional regulator [Pseudonocardia broussonetiae]|uniref:TetR family transcriptional regulator n=1 Tax=Pseudonocardia broussonetiae TaxID=2736640 RepID=A0A6M6JHQ7_9PSEU|nr:TetR family transcriptional regulator [Pseudonocardia broussonetiae]QJY46713.1 TetR family transcriptional regulator [Pseudonocardia broussonetiae]